MSCRWDLTVESGGKPISLLVFCYVQGSIYIVKNLQQRMKRNSPPTSLMSWTVHTKSKQVHDLAPHSKLQVTNAEVRPNGFRLSLPFVTCNKAGECGKLHSGFKVVTWSWVLATTRRWTGIQCNKNVTCGEGTADCMAWNKSQLESTQSEHKLLVDIVNCHMCTIPFIKIIQVLFSYEQFEPRCPSGSHTELYQ